MIFFKILQSFLLPSVFIFVLLLAGSILIFKKKKKTGKAFLVIGLIFYYFFSITPTVDLILKPLENKYQQISAEDFSKADKIVLLLGEKESTILRASEVLRLSNQQLKIIITGASIFNPEKNPAKETKDYLIERGIMPENIILEEKSRNTFESARNIKEIIDKGPFFLVTSAYHMQRSMEVFQKIETNPIPAPTDFKMEKDYNLFSFFPNSKNLEKSDLAFHEYFGILWYRLRY